MPDPIISTAIAIATTYVVQHAPAWLDALRGTLLDKGKEVAIDKGKEFTTTKVTSFVRDRLQLDEKQQQHHLELALKNAVERGVAKFHTQEERDQYRNILTILSEPGAHSDTLRREAMRLFTLSETPNSAQLNEVYNRSLRIRSLTQPTPPAEVAAAAYLTSFFDALIAELYANPFFKQQMSDVLQIRTAMSMQRSLVEVVTTLRQISETIADDYTTEQFEKDIETYITHIERTFRYLKIVGVVPKDRGGENTDPELGGIFVPLRIALQGQETLQNQQLDSTTASLEYYPYLVLLGGPGSGKSTATRYLTWSHAAANQSNSSVSGIPLLSGNPLPLRIELRRLTEDRRHHPDYNFLSYTTEVLLGREGIEINPQMFKELLERRTMLLLFDGLDEVATLHERNRLVEEIEHFALCYPGNRIIVTSRPVGYELARFSNQLFSHAQVQEFNDDQIRQFLEQWYTHVLRLSPIPNNDRQELETLFTTLKENARLHKLAVNPLLLTVITALHRYERLPDRRILVYDRCADLLLETWAKLKGTNVRWKDVKLAKEDQYACVAHLGFVLHERSQERENDSAKEKTNTSTEDTASDVPSRFMLREIEHFLNNRKLITEVAEQRAEAKRFLDLMQVEAGLIVERGTDENGEPLYGFVHRTFQEYFAAADVYELYQQEEDPTIISEFLKEHLHDPHWHEVILLLLGKLKRKPVTTQLRQILEGKSKSRRSQYTDIVQQDLFFVCDCLVEEIAVENELADTVISRLSGLLKNSPFPLQCEEALKYLGSLAQTRQYSESARKELVALVTKDTPIGISAQIKVARVLYKSSPIGSQRQREATQIFFDLAQSPDSTFEQSVEALQTLYQISIDRSNEKQQAAQILLILAQRPHTSFEQSVRAAQVLYNYSPPESVERQQSGQILINLAKKTDIPLEQVVMAAQLLYWNGSIESEEQKEAQSILLDLAKRSDISFDQSLLLARTLYDSRFEYRYYLEGPSKAVQMLLDLVESSNISFEQSIQAAQTLCEILYWGYPQATELSWLFNALFVLTTRPNISLEQLIQIVQVFESTSLISDQEGQIVQILLDKIQKTELSTEESLTIAGILCRYDDHRQNAIKLLLNLVQLPDLPVKQVLQATTAIYQYSSNKSEEHLQATQTLWRVALDWNLTIDQRLQAVKVLLKANFPIKMQLIEEIVQSVKMRLSLAQQRLLMKYLLEEVQPQGFLRNQETGQQTTSLGSQAELYTIPYIVELAQQELLPTKARDEMYQILRRMVPQFDKIPFPNNPPTP